MRPILCILVILGVTGCSHSPARVESLQFDVVTSYPHDSRNFTQGLEWYRGSLYEGVGAPQGLVSEPSRIGAVDLQTGRMTPSIQLRDMSVFGEGITFLGDKLYQLTWQSGVGYVYDTQRWDKISEFKLVPREGWGLTNDGNHLIMSDGSDQLYWINPVTYQVRRTLSVKKDGQGVMRLNELEYVDGMIYANIYLTPMIVRIDAKTGIVTGVLDLSSIMEPLQDSLQRMNVTNGIAYRRETDTFFVTGKLWKKILEIKLK